MTNIEGHIRRTQLLLPPALKVAKSDFELKIPEQLANERKSTPRLSNNLDHWQVAQRFTVQNLTLPPSMPVAKVIEYVY